jgi:hypothetical protein
MMLKDGAWNVQGARFKDVRMQSSCKLTYFLRWTVSIQPVALGPAGTFVYYAYTIKLCSNLGGCVLHLLWSLNLRPADEDAVTAVGPCVKTDLTPEI